MYKFNTESQKGFPVDIVAINNYLEHYYYLRDNKIDEFEAKAKSQFDACQQSFQENFIVSLKQKFQDVDTQRKEFNKALKSVSFNGETYELVISPSKNPDFKEYYRIITSNEDFYRTDLFVNTLSEQNKQTMISLFNALTSNNVESQSKKKLLDFTDYRNYMNYDFKITKSDGEFYFLSDFLAGNSGGERQIPFYVLIVGSYNKMSGSRINDDSLRTVLFDETFNNVDPGNARKIMKFICAHDLQVILATPNKAVGDIIDLADTTIAVFKKNNYAHIVEVQREKNHE